VSATITVPSVVTNKPGLAATWIGVEAPGDPGRFIQIGVNEDSTHLPGTLVFAPSFYAFWSDTRHDFRPVLIGWVNPGDAVHLSLNFAKGRWLLGLRDPRQSFTVRLSTRQESGPMNQAEWLQEDVEMVKTHALFAYPNLSQVIFTHLSAQGKPANAAGLLAQEMRGNPDLTLTPVHDDAFALASVRPSRSS